MLGATGLLIWSGWDGLSSASVWPGWDVPLSVRVGWGGLLPGLAGLAGVWYIALIIKSREKMHIFHP